MSIEQFRDIRVLRKMEREARLLARDLESALRERREAAVQASVRGSFIDQPVTALDTSLLKKGRNQS